jgi:tetratricopeptide (TPR) repeat protein
MDWGVSSDAIDTLFSSTTANTQANLDALAGNMLGQGIDHFQNGDYDSAISAFKRTAALSPFSDNAAKGYDYIGQSYLRQDKTDEAIKTYKEAIRIYPQRDEFHLALGDIYLKQDMPDDALKEFEAAVTLNPDDANSRYSLGQSYLTAGNLDKAQEQFAEVVRLSPISAVGFYGLGQVARAEGNLEDAISQLNNAIRVNKDFEIAYVELGRAYADRGDFQQANDQLAILTAKGSDKTKELTDYITQAQQPQIIAAQSPNGFLTKLEPKTKVSALSSILTDPKKSKLFSMAIAFSKDMDEASIVNPYNWKISRATIRENGSVYNNGVKPPTTEAAIQANPSYITYNSETNTATLRFWISQNANADATIDPSHVVFKFSGVDAYNKTMDAAADEYSGFSSIA